MRVIQNTLLFSELEILLIWPGDVLVFYWVVSTVDCLISAVFSALYCLLCFVQILNWIRNHNNSTFQFKQGGSNSTKKNASFCLTLICPNWSQWTGYLDDYWVLSVWSPGSLPTWSYASPSHTGWVVQTSSNGKRKVGRQVAGLL